MQLKMTLKYYCATDIETVRNTALARKGRFHSERGTLKRHSLNETYQKEIKHSLSK